MKKAMLFTLIMISVGCNKMSALTQPSLEVSQSTLLLRANDYITSGFLPVTQGCFLQLIQDPTDGGLMLNQQTGQFSYVYQDLDPLISGKDKFFYQEVCPSQTSAPRSVVIDTSGLE